MSWYVKYLANDLEIDEEEILNKEYLHGRDKYKLVGYNSKAKTYPLIMENIKTGKKYKFDEFTIRNVLSRRVA